MSAGLQVWNENGKLIFDSSLHTTYALGIATTGNSAGSITDNNINNRNVWIIIISRSTYLGSDKYFANSPYFTVSGNTISWSFPTIAWGGNGDASSVNFMYGVY